MVDCLSGDNSDEVLKTGRGTGRPRSSFIGRPIICRPWPKWCRAISMRVHQCSACRDVKSDESPVSGPRPAYPLRSGPLFWSNFHWAVAQSSQGTAISLLVVFTHPQQLSRRVQQLMTWPQCAPSRWGFSFGGHSPETRLHVSFLWGGSHSTAKESPMPTELRPTSSPVR
jgi:hypothetical protein